MSNYQYYEYQNSGNYSNPYEQTPPPKKPKNPNSFGKKLVKATAIGLVFGLAAGAAFTGTTYVANKTLGTTAAQTPVKQEEEKPKTAKTLNTTESSEGSLDTTAVSTATTVTDVSDIVENVMPAVVQVTCVSITEYRNWFGQVGTYESEGAGSGVIIAQNDEYIYIATNNHVVSGARQLTVTFADDTAIEGELKGTDPDTDLAVVRVKVADISSDTLSKIKVATLGSSEELAVGDSAVVIGNALGYGQSVTTGVVSALNREVQLRAEDGTIITNSLIQTDAAVNPGNSGGALLNMNGEVIGIVSAKYSDTDVEGMGYAIPITQANSILTQLMNGSSVQHENMADNGAYLGISGVDVDAVTARQYNMPTGVYVSRVISGSGAAAAGIEKGDVIVAFNGRTVMSMSDIQKELSALSPGNEVSVTVSREENGGYTEKAFNVTLTEKQ
ncbi:MAG: trypsin-like peptidase domain-containing protein [Lachnospiraceae bacterium]|nr:trypsin-like peptidase domain-containing protein [Lachnospiraceae bacterium]